MAAARHAPEPVPPEPPTAEPALEPAARPAGELAAESARLRVRPRQARSQARIAAALDAAEELLATGGVGAVTTTRIAARAGIAVGSVYRYFPDKAAIFDALATRFLREFEALMDDLAARAGAETWGDPVGLLVDAYAEHYRSRPALRAIWFGSGLSEALSAADRRHKKTMASGVARILVALGVARDAAQVALASHAAVLAADALIQQAFRADPVGQTDLLEEAKRLLRAYLAAIVERLDRS